MCCACGTRAKIGSGYLVEAVEFRRTNVDGTLAPAWQADHQTYLVRPCSGYSKRRCRVTLR